MAVASKSRTCLFKAYRRNQGNWIEQKESKEAKSESNFSVFCRVGYWSSGLQGPPDEPYRKSRPVGPQQTIAVILCYLWCLLFNPIFFVSFCANPERGMQASRCARQTRTNY